MCTLFCLRRRLAADTDNGLKLWPADLASPATGLAVRSWSVPHIICAVGPLRADDHERVLPDAHIGHSICKDTGHDDTRAPTPSAPPETGPGTMWFAPGRSCEQAVARAVLP